MLVHALGMHQVGCGANARRNSVVFSVLAIFLLAIPGAMVGAQQKSSQTHSVAPPSDGRKVQSRAPAKAVTTRLGLAKRMAAQPLEFFQVGDQRSGARFVAHGAGYSLTLGDASMVLTSQRRVKPDANPAKPAADGGMSAWQHDQSKVQIESALVEFLGANRNARVEGLEPSDAYANFMIGSDPSQWRNHVTGYERVRYTELYPGIDLVYHGELHHKLEYDLVVAPGADPQQIRLKVTSDHEARIGRDGDLELDGPDGVIRLDAPVLYQNIPGGKKAITGGFVQLAQNEFGFRSMSYDATRPLIIDPTINLLYSTFAGGIHDDAAFDMTLDASGNVYIAGWAASQDFPVTANALQQVRQNIGSYVYDAVVMKFDASGNVLFSTFLGGQQNDQGIAIQVNRNGEVLLAGYTQSSDFPVTTNAYQKNAGGGTDAFFSVISNDGSQLLYSSYLGGPGDESIAKMAQDASGAIWLAGGASAAGLPATTGAYQAQPNGNDNSFIAKVEFNAANAQPLKIDALTFLGGSHNGEENQISDIAFDSSGNVYVTGGSNSTDFPTTANAYEKASVFTLSGGCYNSPNPNSIILVSELSADLKTLIYSTALGGKIEDQNGYPDCNQFGRTIHPDNKGNIWVIGTVGMQDFPTTSNALSKQLNGNGLAGVDDFVVELTPGTNSTTLTYGSFLGGSQFDYGASAIWDANDNIWIISNTQSTDWPGVVAGTALQAANAGGYDMTITELQPDATKILYATYLGGSGDEDANYGHSVFKMDANANLYMAGGTASANFPTTPTAFQSTFANSEPNPDGYDIYYVVLGSGTIGTVGPLFGGNTGDTSITIDGAGYASGATCSLVQGDTTIASVAATVNSSGTSVTCTFALNGAATGSYDVVVSNPDGSSFTKQGGFTVQSGGQPNLTASIVGRPIIRTGFPSTFYVNVTNSGNENAYFTPLWITLPVGITFSVNGYSQSDSASLSSNDGKTLYANFLLPNVAPGQTVAVPLTITSSTDSTGIALTASLQPPWFSSSAAMATAFSAGTIDSTCVTDPNSSYSLNCLGPFLNSLQLGQRFYTSMARRVQHNIQPAVKPMDTPSNCPAPNPMQEGYDAGVKDHKDNTHTPNPYSPFWSQNAVTWQIAYNAAYIGSSGPSVPGGNVIPVRSGMNHGPNLDFNPRPHDGESCPVPPPPPPKPLPPPASSTPPSGSSVDPNYKSGPGGDNSKSAYVRGSAALTYAVGFENEATAAFPADTVVVTDQLDPTKVDLTTLTLGSISFGTNVISLPGGTSNYNTTYNINSSLSVRIQGSLNSTTGLLKWTFTSIDPSTGLPPTDPTIGFLPPDTDGVKGQGSVQFNVMPLSGQKTGIQVTNTASVVFDTNAAIQTPTWLNTLDVDAPVSSVAKLPAAQTTADTSATFTVSWSGTDQGSGIGSYDVYVSDNGGAFATWQTGVTATSASYTGSLGHTYGFYSIATDAAGNEEEAKTVADTTTTVAPPTPLTSVTTLTASATSIGSGGSVTLTAVVAPPSGTSTIPTGTATFLNGSTTLGTVTLDGTGTAAYTSKTLPVGTDSITASYSGDAIFAASTSSAVSVVVGSPTFALSLNPTSASVASGSSATTTVSATPAFGFASAISFSCSGLPADSTCSFAPATVTPAGGKAGTTSLTIATGVASTANFKVTQGIGGAASGILFAIIFLPWGVMVIRRRADSNSLYRLFILLTVVGIFAAVSGCGGGSGSSNKTPRGTSTVTVTGTAGGATETATFQLTVQ